MTDVWGAIAIPIAPSTDPLLLPAGDPALFYIGDFLKTFLTTDGNALAQWTQVGVAPNVAPIKTVIYGRPDDKTRPLDVAALPALYVFRTGGSFDRWGEDYEIVRDKLTLLWVFPSSAGPEVRRRQLPFANALVKVIYDGLELGRTPSWVQAGDPDPNAATRGSYYWTYAAFVHLDPKSWRTTFVHVDDVSGRRVGDFPAVEIVYELIENRVRGTDGLPATAGTLAITSAVIVDFASWAAAASFTVPAFVVPTASNGRYYACVSPGTTGGAEPAWLTAPGAFVVDGTVTWRCVGRTSYRRWEPSHRYALGDFVVPASINGYYYQCTALGTSGASAPAWPTTPGDSVVDGTASWTCVALTSVESVSGPL